ncbi:MAG: SpoIIE family protein phosphatase [Phycisphaerae bacterium]|nr:SpoIIE family protein phosphatase [Phycisphaerae bacterium]
MTPPSEQNSSRIAALMDTVSALTRASRSQQALDIFVDGVRKAYQPYAACSLDVRGLGSGTYRIERLINAAGEDVTPGKPTGTKPAPVQQSGALAELIATPGPRIVRGLHLDGDAVVGTLLAGVRSAMLAPRVDEGNISGWSIVFADREDAFSDRGLEDLVIRSSLLGAVLANVRVAEQLQQANHWIESEIDRIAKIQSAMLPQPMPQIPRLSIAAGYQTYDRAGGDYYDMLPIDPDPGRSQPDPNDPWCIVIADASGHGPAGAVVVAMLHAILHSYPGRTASPSEVLGHVNRHLYAKRVEASFVTAVLGFFHPRDLTFTYARAGHCPPILKGATPDEPLVRLDAVGGLPLCVDQGFRYEEATIQLAPGQTLVLYTDGIPDAVNPARQHFGESGIERALSQCGGEPECVVRSVHCALRTHEAGQRPTDDQTIVALQVRPL